MAKAERTDPALNVIDLRTAAARESAAREDAEEREIMTIGSQILGEIAETKRLVGEVREQVASINGANLGGQLADHEARLRVLESSRSEGAGKAAGKRATLEGWRLWLVVACAVVGSLSSVAAIATLALRLVGRL